MKNEYGSVDFGEDLASFRSRGQVMTALVVAALLSAGLVVGIIYWAWPDWVSAAIGLAALSAYVVLAFYVRPKPNHDNLGAGGIVDRPFRVSDDVNRGLVQLVIFFAPGRYISTGLVDGYHLVQRGKLPQDRLMEKIASSEARTE